MTEEAEKVQHPGKQTRGLEWAAEEPGICTKPRTWGKPCLKIATQKLIAERWTKRVPTSFGEVSICSWISPGSSGLYVRRRNSPRVPETAGVRRFFPPSFHKKPLQSFLRTTTNPSNTQTLYCPDLLSSACGSPYVQQPFASQCFRLHKAQVNFLYTTIISLFSISNKTFTWDY